MNSCSSLLDVFLADAKPNEHYAILEPDVTREEFIDKHPPVKRKSLPLPIKSTYSYSFTVKDFRPERKTWLGIDRCTLTNLKARS